MFDALGTGAVWPSNFTVPLLVLAILAAVLVISHHLSAVLIFDFDSFLLTCEVCSSNIVRKQNTDTYLQSSMTNRRKVLD